jgi:hypothetical protein
VWEVVCLFELCDEGVLALPKRQGDTVMRMPGGRGRINSKKFPKVRIVGDEL